MKKCRLKVQCASCEHRLTCPAAVRHDKRARRPMSDSASPALLRRAGKLLNEGWYTCAMLGIALYGKPKEGKKARMSIMVRARRPINKLKKLGLLAARPDATGAAEYTLLPGSLEVI